MNKKTVTVLFALHIMLIIYSFGGVLSKMAANTTFLSIDYCLYYGGILLLLVLYAIVWQQIIKVLPLTVAFANKAVIVIWGVVWGILIFNETIGPMQIIGILFIISGVVIYSVDMGGENNCQN